MAHPVIAAQDALKAILDARPAWDDVAINDGGPTEADDIRFDTFWFNDATITSDHWNQLGGGMRRCEFLLSFTVAVRKSYDDERATRSRALDLLEDFMAAIKANPNLSQTVQQVNDVTGTVGSAPVDTHTWGAWFTGTLQVQSLAY